MVEEGDIRYYTDADGETNWQGYVNGEWKDLDDRPTWDCLVDATLGCISMCQNCCEPRLSLEEYLEFVKNVWEQ